jgi:hypothetical protein
VLWIYDLRTTCIPGWSHASNDSYNLCPRDADHERQNVFVAELLGEALKRVIQKQFLTFITAKNRVAIVRTPEHGSSEVLFQESGHEREDRNELPLYIINEFPVHIILSAFSSLSIRMVPPLSCQCPVTPDDHPFSA